MAEDSIVVTNLIDLELAPDQWQVLDELIARGYTVRRIQQLLLFRGWTVLPSATAIITYKAQEANSDRIERLRKEEERASLTVGIARKPERLRRLQELIEKLETQIFEADGSKQTRLVDTYLKVLNAAKEEMDPTTLAGWAAQEDAWARLTGERSNSSALSSESHLLPSNGKSSNLLTGES